MFAILALSAATIVSASYNETEKLLVLSNFNNSLVGKNAQVTVIALVFQSAVWKLFSRTFLRLQPHIRCFHISVPFMSFVVTPFVYFATASPLFAYSLFLFRFVTAR